MKTLADQIKNIHDSLTTYGTVEFRIFGMLWAHGIAKFT
jgi:hypothetical protein